MADLIIESTSRRPSQNNGYATPAHSAQNSLHSFRSSTPTRSPLHALSLHEYRKLQRTPTPSSQAPQGKSLRRKAATPELREFKRAPSTAGRSASPASLVFRPSHFSISLQHLAGYQPLPPSPPHWTDHFEAVDESYRPQNTEDTRFGEAAAAAEKSVGGFPKETQKVGRWKTIKKLPRPQPRHPQSPLPSAHIPPHAIGTHLSSSQSISTSVTEIAPSSDAPTSTSTLSLSRFPRPPHPESFVSLSSQSLDVNALPRINTSFTTALATPPETPAVIRYRGASFDLVNPHDSILLHDIETPNDLHSCDGSPMRTSDEFLARPDIAPRNRVSTDFGAAWSLIRSRDEREESHGHQPYTQLSPPPPAVLSPRSAEVASPMSPDEPRTALPSSVGRTKQEEPRFSLRELAPIKHLSRTFTRRLNKAPEPTEEQVEEQELEGLPAGAPASVREEHQPVYVDDDEYYPTLATTYQPIESFSYSPLESTAGLTSMVPDQLFDQPMSASEPLYPPPSLYSNEWGLPQGYYSPRATGVFGLEDQTNRNPFHGPNTCTIPNSIPTAEYLSGQEEIEVASGATAAQIDDGDTVRMVNESVATAYGVLGDESHGLVTGGRSALHHLALQAQGVGTDSSHSSLELLGQVREGRGREPTLRQTPEPSTPAAASLESSFEYDNFINILNQSPESASTAPPQQLEPGQSSSQSENLGTLTRQAALDDAGRIFDEAEASSSIPAMWQRHSGTHLVKTRPTAVPDNDEDWETGQDSRYSADAQLLHNSTLHESHNSAVACQREESHRKLDGPAPEADLPGTSQGTEIHDAGSSVADNSNGSHGRRRSAVTGQTKLREMKLTPSIAPSARFARSVQSNESGATRFSEIMRFDAPSLRAPSSVTTDSPLTRQSVTPGHDLGSPHLHVTRREPTAEDCAERTRLSWIVFGLFCILPPLLILYRWFGDSMVNWVSGGRFTTATVTPKRAALYLGVPVNILIVTAIAIPIFIAMA
ncbi:uncharacterized protein EI97DRAFT_457153 [Westerdykella ornata]|uniref:Uncharacterized protein n=1 Tax=Westerdykella ornata TaxID=318751 RepID=A0A6A6JN18_WESOR|nr:uncharacterized protein EI97DRAFT_457153 [Westerdykella ornata]KAF2277917.1 hypothetical protein EI97DRAFT_457153 [Westerdykella ornata]